MAYAGQILENPVSGERIVFRKTAADTAGELFAFELFLTPDAHRFENAGNEPAHVLVEVSPALRMEQLFETALAREGRTNRKGMPKPLELAVFVREFEREVRAPFSPVGVVRAVMAPLVWLATLQGLDERYRRPSPVSMDGTLPAHADPSYPAAGEEVA